MALKRAPLGRGLIASAGNHAFPRADHSIHLNTGETDTSARIDELRARLEQLDAERTAVSAELHRLAEPGSVLPTIPPATKDPIANSGHKDWHVFAGPVRHGRRKPKS